VPIGWLRISHFQETTPQEVREAIAALQTPSEQDEGMRALILDLRGCPGGRFKSAVQVAELFLSQGVIVYSQSPFRDYNRPYRVEGVHPLLVPMVVLIDGETASAAEVVASALKDLGRARLVGQTTFGKGSIQCIIPLDRPPLERMPGGIRITIARFSSPAHQQLDGRGVSPHVAVLSTNDQVMLTTARTVLLGLLRPSAPLPVPADGLPMGMGPMQ
jgi:carboxyl-terminal processing protease